MNYTREHIEFLSLNAPGVSYKNLTEKFNAFFGTDTKPSQIKSVSKRYGIRNGRNTRFLKGHIPFITGTKGFMKRNSGSFKKGNVPKSYRPVGSERINVDGYAEIKVADPNKWRQKHLVVWENIHGKVLPGHAIIFADGNKMNVSIDNLIMVKRSELLYMNRKKLIFNDADLTKTAANMARLDIKIFEKQKERL